jgi:hypothetical protein
MINAFADMFNIGSGSLIINKQAVIVSRRLKAILLIYF